MRAVRIVTAIFLATYVTGCSSIKTLATDIGLIDPPKHHSVRSCDVGDINAFNSLYIDSSSNYYSSGSVLVYGRNGKQCRLNLRYK
jgi:hypothetical protein